MKLNIFKKIYLTSCIIIGSVCATSCSAFFGDEILSITSTNVETNSDGSMVVTINFADDKSPLTFTIPKAINGEDGVGIANVVSSLNDDNTIVTITITYTNDKEPTIISVPVYRGKDGKEIVSVISDFDEYGNTTIKFKYSDGSESETFTINKGEDGKGIKDIQINDDGNGNYELVISFTDGTSSSPLYLNSGVGILSVTYDDAKSNDENYCLVITYSDGRTSDLYVPIPTVNRWLSGNSVPSDEIGNDNDFYVVESTGAVYRKTAGIWRYLFSIKGVGSDLTYKVTFNLNGGKRVNGDLTNPDISSTEKRYIDRLTYGSFIDLDQNMLKCYNENVNLIFMGWWTDSVITPNSGHFTKLTPVTTDLELYAIRETK